MLEKRTFIVATLKKWHKKVFNEKIKYYNGNWILIDNPQILTQEKLEQINPKYIFFPHWSEIVPENIIKNFECVCFHETDLPFGRGGSPIQNLIVRGYRETCITAFKMTEDLDAGPVYLKKKLCLEGLAEEIYLRSAHIMAEMIQQISQSDIVPREQEGKIIKFKRRNPKESNIENAKLKNLMGLFDFIRMLDAESYPKAFLEVNGFRFEFSRPALKTDEIIADVRITKKGNAND